jgi:DNA-binding transcriptional regulator LsrR (DeoR family)
VHGGQRFERARVDPSRLAPVRDGRAMTELAVLVRASRLYYELGETQEAIAARMGVTRPQVSRLLKEARARGVVEIRVVDRTAVESPASAALRERFGLRAVHVAPPATEAPDVTRRRVGRLAGETLRAAIRDGMVVGIGDGASVAAVADELPLEGPDVDATVVPLCGGFWRSGAGSEPFRRIADALGATAYELHAPGLLDTGAVRDALLAHHGVRPVVDLWSRIDVALVGIGGPTWSEASVGRGALAEIQAEGAVGEILIAPFSIEGRFVGDSLRARTIAFDARKLAGVPLVIGVADGPVKVAPILGALRSGVLDVLITDAPTAEAVVALADRRAA